MEPVGAGASYDVLDPLDVCRRLKRFGARNCTTGVSPQSLHDISVEVHGTNRSAGRLRELGFRQVPSSADRRARRASSTAPAMHGGLDRCPCAGRRRGDGGAPAGTLRALARVMFVKSIAEPKLALLSMNPAANELV